MKATYDKIERVIPKTGPVARLVLWVYDFGGDEECRCIGPVYPSVQAAEKDGARCRAKHEIVTLAEYARRRGKLLINVWRRWDRAEKESVRVNTREKTT